MSLFKKGLFIVIGSLVMAVGVCRAGSLDQKLQGLLNNCRQSIDKSLNTSSGISMSVYIPWRSKDHIYNFVSGYTSTDKKEKVVPNNLFQIGSISKSFTSAIILQLQDEGKLNIDNDTVGEYLPQYPRWRNIKIYRLLNMTSGIYNWLLDRDFILKYLHNMKKVWQLDELAQYAYDKDSDTSSGKFYYSNTNYILLGMIIEKVTGKSFGKVLDDRILNNKDYGFRKNIFYWDNTLRQELRKYLVHSYCYFSGIIPPFSYGQEVVEDSLSWLGSAGAIISTTEDEARWYKLLFVDKKILPEYDIKKMVNDYNVLMNIPMYKGYWYGLGIEVEPLNQPGIPQNYKLFRYDGETFSSMSRIIYSPEDGFIIAVSINDSILFSQQGLDIYSLCDGVTKALLQDKCSVGANSAESSL